MEIVSYDYVYKIWYQVLGTKYQNLKGCFILYCLFSIHHYGII